MGNLSKVFVLLSISLEIGLSIAAVTQNVDNTLSMEPQLNDDGTYNPSPFASQFLLTKTDYAPQEQSLKYMGNKRILVICTDERKMEMANGKVFNTGNNPVEMFGPMLHIRDAGFKFDFATPNGRPVAIEMWAYPNEDENVKNLHDEVRVMMEKPKKLSDIKNLDKYSAIFIPGGHGTMLNLHNNTALGNLLNIAHERKMPTVVICHGPAAYLSTSNEITGKEFVYKGYKTMIYTDKTDKFSPTVGYLPGPMPWFLQEKIEKLGVEVLNEGETGATFVDRELITGDSPQAHDNLGKLAAPLLVEWAIKNDMRHWNSDMDETKLLFNL